MIDFKKFLKNLFAEKQNLNDYASHDEAVIMACYYNPTDSKYRKFAFDKFYESIKHLNHRIIECCIGDQRPQLPDSEYIQTIYVNQVLWYKEALLNKLIKELPSKFKYVFWVDADVIFANKNWLLDSVNVLQKCNVMQPWEYVINMEQDEIRPSYDLDYLKKNYLKNNIKIRKSFASNIWSNDPNVNSFDYTVHGHTGYAWGANRKLLDECFLFDNAIIGTGDSIMAMSFYGDLSKPCIQDSFRNSPEMLDMIKEYKDKVLPITNGIIGSISGDIYHIWHGDLNKREYQKRTQNFNYSYSEVQKDANGMPVSDDNISNYVGSYMAFRELHGDGSILTPNDSFSTDQGGKIEFEFGGGEFGGGGAGGGYDDLNKIDSNNDIS